MLLPGSAEYYPHAPLHVTSLFAHTEHEAQGLGCSLQVPAIGLDIQPLLLCSRQCFALNLLCSSGKSWTYDPPTSASCISRNYVTSLGSCFFFSIISPEHSSQRNPAETQTLPLFSSKHFHSSSFPLKFSVFQHCTMYPSLLSPVDRLGFLAIPFSWVSLHLLLFPSHFVHSLRCYLGPP